MSSYSLTGQHRYLRAFLVQGGFAGRLRRFTTREQARQAVMDWIGFYNHSRLHSTLGYLSPMQYEQRWLAAQRKIAA